MAENLPRAFVCGHPIKHSRSPMIHGYWLTQYGIEGSYQAVDIAPEDFSSFLKTLRAQGFVGGNLTIPHKEAALKIVDRLDPSASEIGAVNTVWLRDGLLWGANSDYHGFAANLDQCQPGWDKSKIGVILGAGGASRAIIYALQSRGFTDIRVLNRTVSRAQDLADAFGPTVSAHSLADAKVLLADAGLVVNATSVGMQGDEGLPIDPDWLAPETLVSDIVYVPLETPLLAAARQRGLPTVDGLGMLLHQATLGFERWFGVQPVVTEELRALVVADLGPKP